jgi:hypothetical protein
MAMGITGKCGGQAEQDLGKDPLVWDAGAIWPKREKTLSQLPPSSQHTECPRYQCLNTGMEWCITNNIHYLCQNRIKNPNLRGQFVTNIIFSSMNSRGRAGKYYWWWMPMRKLA